MADTAEDIIARRRQARESLEGEETEEDEEADDGHYLHIVTVQRGSAAPKLVDNTPAALGPLHYTFDQAEATAKGAAVKEAEAAAQEAAAPDGREVCIYALNEPVKEYVSRVVVEEVANEVDEDEIDTDEESEEEGAKAAEGESERRLHIVTVYVRRRLFDDDLDVGRLDVLWSPSGGLHNTFGEADAAAKKRAASGECEVCIYALNEPVKRYVSRIVVEEAVNGE